MWSANGWSSRSGLEKLLVVIVAVLAVNAVLGFVVHGVVAQSVALIVAELLLVCALLFTTFRWMSFVVAAVLLVELLLGFSHLRDQLSHPDDTFTFVRAIIAFIALIAGISVGIVARLQKRQPATTN